MCIYVRVRVRARARVRAVRVWCACVRERVRVRVLYMGWESACNSTSDSRNLSLLHPPTPNHFPPQPQHRFLRHPLDFSFSISQIIISLEEPLHGDWETAKFAPEAEFLAEAGKIEGLKRIDTQTYTIMPL